ncbi:MAG: methyltransferase domain-containing protein [Betaproteobacteria bacterium]|nr:methyltransferase domain-containing protein [Betaproteobacteria bacterium]
MLRPLHSIKLPITEPHQLDQDEAYFYLRENGRDLRIRFHDYGEIYRRPGLYEQIFYQRLKCVSPKKVANILSEVLHENRVEISELRVLDLGAGNGMFGEQLQTGGVSRMVGVDIAPEAEEACLRDRPGVYDAYYVADLCKMTADIEEQLKAWHLDCLSCVAALGFGDIPATAFANAFNLIAPGGWVAFNIKESFLLESDQSGFSNLIKSLMMSDALEVHHLERYRHRISIDGKPLFYYALVGKKEYDIPADLMAKLD